MMFIVKISTQQVGRTNLKKSAIQVLFQGQAAWNLRLMNLVWFGDMAPKPNHDNNSTMFRDIHHWS